MPGAFPCKTPHRHFPNPGQCCGQASPVVLTAIATVVTSATAVRELCKNKVSLSQVLEGTWASQEPQSKVMGGERVSMDLGFCLYWD